MQKVNIKLKINDYSLEEEGYLNNDILSFKDQDLEKTEIIYDLKHDILIRDNKEITIKLNFKEKENNMKCLIKKENIELSNNFECLSLLKEKNNIIINYRIDETTFNLKIEYKEV